MFKVLLGVASLGLAAAACPNQCSGHGTCGANDICTCFSNWQASDCSQRTCAYAVAWADVPSFDETAHGMEECAGRGLCDRETGLCDCFPGYEGKGCSRQSCPSDCSGHGTCEYMDEMASDDHPRYGAMDVTYSAWDAGAARLCRCDAGWEGSDCSLRMCPRGDDALTTTAASANVQCVRMYVQDPPAELVSTATLRKGYNRDINVTIDDIWATAAVGDRVRFGPQGATPPLYGYDNYEYTISEISPGNITIEEPIFWGSEEAGVAIHHSPSRLAAGIAGGEFYATYYDPYGGMWNTSEIAHSGTTTTLASNLQSALRELPVSALTGVVVSGSDDTSGYTSDGVRTRRALANSQVLLVTFAAAAGQFGEQHKLVINTEAHSTAGSWPISAGITTTAGENEIVVAEVTHEGSAGVTQADVLSENSVCGGRGICDQDEGICECFEGWKGLACGSQEALI